MFAGQGNNRYDIPCIMEDNTHLIKLKGFILYTEQTCKLQEPNYLKPPTRMKKLTNSKRGRALLLITLLIINTGFNMNPVLGQISISGKVSDENGVALPGANIIVKGTIEGTVTDLDGKYSVEVPDAGSILVFSFIGYTDQEITVGNQIVIDVQLLAEIMPLDQVVVVGYGTQEKRSITGSISVADVEVMEKSESFNVTNRLQGLVPGVIVVGDGEPGSIGQIRIRGNVFLGVDEGEGANNPLFVIDGVLTDDNRFLNPNDIESVQVLKDASSTAIYGSRAANGVIIITTKKAKPGRPKINFSARFGLQQIPDQIELANTEHWARINRAIYAGGTPDQYADTSATGLYDPNRYTDWQAVMTQTAPIRDLNFSISKGSENSNVYFSASNARQEGVIGNPVFERYNMRVNSDIRLNKKLKIGQNLTVGRTKLSNPSGELGAIYGMLPVVPVYDENNPSGYGYGDDVNARTYASNPKALTDLMFNETTGNHVLGNVFLNFEIIPDLEYELNASIDLEQSHNKSYYEQGQIAWLTTLLSGLTEEDSEFYSWFIEHKLQYQKTLGKHNFSAMASYVGQQEKGQEHSTSINGGYTFEGKNYWVINASTAPNTNYTSGGQESTYAMESFLGRLTYDYDQKYLLNFMIRHDGSSRFAEDVRWGTFPSISGGWIVSGENFFSSVPVVNFFKIRAGYGMVGNATGEDYVYQSELILRSIGGVNYNLGPAGTSVLGATRGKLANTSLQWEKLVELNIGTDIRLFESRLELIADYFNRQTSDLIHRRPLPPSVGAEQTSIIENNAGIKGNGFELAARFKNRAGDFIYNIGANLTYMKSELSKLPNEPYISDSEEANYIKARSFVGQPLGQYFLLDYTGIYTQEDIDALPDGFTVYNQVPVVGDARFVDHGSDPQGELAGAPDGKINEYDRIAVGNVYPFQYGITLNASYKAFDLTLFFQGITRWDVYNNWYEYLITNDFSNYPADYNPYIDGQGTDPRAVFGFTHFSKLPSTRYLENGSYFRLKNLQIGYNIPIKRINTFRIYFSGQNLFTLTKYRGLDPEFLGPMFAPGDDPRGFPNLRTFSVGINLSF
jgi:TonB-linked SusC/RagA family outer membrane protein